MAPDTTAKLKIVFAKSYSDQATGTMARPLGVRPARPPGRGRRDRAAAAALATAR